MSVADVAESGSDAGFVRLLPKAELHCHLDGSLRAATLYDLAQERGVRLPAEGVEALARHMRADGAGGLAAYLRKFDVTLSVMQDANAISRIAEELVLDASADGVRYIEVRYCPALSSREGLSVAAVMEAVLRGLSVGETRCGTVARFIVCALRSLPPTHAVEMAELAIAYKGAVVGFDLAGDECNHSAAAFSEAFARARNGDLAVTVHAGEARGADSIREAVHLCGANRIGHGTRLREDPSLMAYVADRGIPLEVCLTSNLQTGVADSIAEHPVRSYLGEGIRVTINTDNTLLGGTSLSEEYLRCIQELGLSRKMLASLALESFRAAFLPVARRRELYREARATMALILGESDLEPIGP